MQKTKTYFEQVPLDALKKLVGDPVAEQSPAKSDQPRKKRTARERLRGRRQSRARSLTVSPAEA
jgi:hypothetical protein